MSGEQSMDAMSFQGQSGQREIPLRACCGKLRFALLDIVEGLAGQPVRLRALKWGIGEVPLGLDLAGREPQETVEAILAATERFFGTNPSCFTGGGALIVESKPQTSATADREVSSVSQL